MSFNGTTAYSTWQSIPGESFRFANQGAGTLATFPKGFKYEVEIRSTLESYGAASVVRILIDGVVVSRFLNGTDRSGTEKSVNTVIDTITKAKSITQVQNSGTNAEFDHVINYRTTPQNRRLSTIAEIDKLGKKPKFFRREIKKNAPTGKNGKKGAKK